MTPVPAAASVKRPWAIVERIDTTDGPTLATTPATFSVVPDSASVRATELDALGDPKMVVAPRPSSACVATAAVPPERTATATSAAERRVHFGEGEAVGVESTGGAASGGSGAGGSTEGTPAVASSTSVVSITNSVRRQPGDSL